jgi:PST family polysaccharide transporter
MNYFSRNIDNFIVGYKFGSQSLGYYKKAYDLFALPVNLLTSRLTDVAIATLSRYKNDPKIFLKYYLESISILSFVGMGISLVATINSKDIILLILGAQWSIAGEIFTYFSPGIGVMLVYGTNGWLHLSLGRADRWLKWGVIELSVTVLLFLIGTNWGPSGIAVAWTTSFYVLLFPGLLFAGRPVNLKLLVIVDGIWRYLLSALISGVICWYCLYEVEFISVVFHHLNLVGRILTSCIFSLSIYLTMIIIFHRNIDPIIRLLSIARQMIPGNRRP